MVVSKAIWIDSDDFYLSDPLSVISVVSLVVAVCAFILVLCLSDIGIDDNTRIALEEKKSEWAMDYFDNKKYENKLTKTIDEFVKTPKNNAPPTKAVPTTRHAKGPTYTWHSNGTTVTVTYPNGNVITVEKELLPYLKN